DGFVVRGLFWKAHPAAVRDGHSRLLENKALLGIFEIDARVFGPGGFLSQDLEHTAFHDPLVVFPGMDSVGGQLESGLAFDAAMTPGGVAAAAREDTDDVAREAEGPLLIRALNGKRGLRRKPTDGCSQDRCSIGRGEYAARFICAG